MKSIADVVSGAGLAGYAEVALVIFVLVFVVVGLRVLLSRRSSFAHEAHLPFDDSIDSGELESDPNSLIPIRTRGTRQEH